jgi:hypothetical protein
LDAIMVGTWVASVPALLEPLLLDEPGTLELPEVDVVADAIVGTRVAVG